MTKSSGRGPARWVAPVTIIGISLLAFWQSTQFERVPPILKRGMQPSDFPQLVLLLIIALALYVLVKEKRVTVEKLHPKALSSAGLLIAFALLAEVDLFLGLGVFSAALCLSWGDRRPGAILFVGLVVPMLIFFFFDTVFDIRFPRGLLTNLWYG
ncbi:tripartite tricarboxylate transporter TctB family protein [Candidatus Halocynthiibacter alkanivorans]|uniref:tripartite tricarboxylate transporter TctB family protein n=1 Tax=Candidatus Halocynthiibacter alkanivorans TaxID=2267619 RepID=UPI000DF4358E|nr:tripartite tricarboxylate transporter TctB family protein [Candidatus Halocynthiibacter alkanivorans]